MRQVSALGDGGKGLYDLVGERVDFGWEQSRMILSLKSVVVACRKVGFGLLCHVRCRNKIRTLKLKTALMEGWRALAAAGVTQG